MTNHLKTIRENLKLTQIEFSRLLNIPVKSIRNWEQNVRTPSDYMIDLIINSAIGVTQDDRITDENNNQILSFLFIKNKVKEVARKYPIEKIYLYGSYAKGLATIDSDIDLFMISDIDGIDYFGVIEDFRQMLNKKIDLLSNKTIKLGSKIEEEIYQTGVLIYER